MVEIRLHTVDTLLVIMQISVERRVLQATQLMLTNPRDAFRGRSRSTNMVNIRHVRYGFLLMCYLS